MANDLDFTLDAWHMLGITECWAQRMNIGPWETLSSFQWKDEAVSDYVLRKCDLVAGGIEARLESGMLVSMLFQKYRGARRVKGD